MTANYVQPVSVAPHVEVPRAMLERAEPNPLELVHPRPITVFVPGTPRPQGSKQARPIYKGRGPDRTFTGKVAQVESSEYVKMWRDDIRAAVLDEPHTRLDGPVAVTLTFVMPRPRSHYRTGRNAHLLRASAPARPTGKPDVDKLVRAVLDAIGSAGAWRDDSQVVELTAAKRYARHTSQPGAHITITPLED